MVEVARVGAPKEWRFHCFTCSHCFPEATNAEIEDQCPLRVISREAEILQVGFRNINHGTVGTVQALRCSARVGLWSTTVSGCRPFLC